MDKFVPSWSIVLSSTVPLLPGCEGSWLLSFLYTGLSLSYCSSCNLANSWWIFSCSMCSCSCLSCNFLSLSLSQSSLLSDTLASSVESNRVLDKEWGGTLQVTGVPWDGITWGDDFHKSSSLRGIVTDVSAGLDKLGTLSEWVDGISTTFEDVVITDNLSFCWMLIDVGVVIVDVWDVTAAPLSSDRGMLLDTEGDSVVTVRMVGTAIVGCEVTAAIVDCELTAAVFHKLSSDILLLLVVVIDDVVIIRGTDSVVGNVITVEIGSFSLEQTILVVCVWLDDNDGIEVTCLVAMVLVGMGIGMFDIGGGILDLDK